MLLLLICMSSHGSVAGNMTLEQPHAKSRFAVVNSATTGVVAVQPNQSKVTLAILEVCY